MRQKAVNLGIGTASSAIGLGARILANGALNLDAVALTALEGIWAMAGFVAHRACRTLHRRAGRNHAGRAGADRDRCATTP